MQERREAVIDPEQPYPAELLRDGRDAKLAQSVVRLFGASSIDECIQTYAALGNAESSQLDDVVKRVIEDVSSVFSLRVDNQVAE